jgi:hypothetical protein
VYLAADLSRSDLVMDRRAATRALAAATTGAAFLDSLEAWLAPAPPIEEHRSHGRLGKHDIEELEACARAFRTYKIGGGLRRKAVVGQLNEVAAHLDEHQATHIQQGLLRVLAQLSATVASMAWEAGTQLRAQDYYRLALRAAHAGNDPLFGANTLAAMARQMLYLDRPGDAIELVHLAQHGIRRQATPRLSAMLATREAWAYAAMGRTSAFRRTTEEGADSLERRSGSSSKDGGTESRQATIFSHSGSDLGEHHSRISSRLVNTTVPSEPMGRQVGSVVGAEPSSWR